MWNLKFQSFVYRVTLADSNIGRSLENEFVSGGSPLKRDNLTKAGKLGLRLLEDLTALAAGGSVCADTKLVLFFFLQMINFSLLIA